MGDAPRTLTGRWGPKVAAAREEEAEMEAELSINASRCRPGIDLMTDGRRGGTTFKLRERTSRLLHASARNGRSWARRTGITLWLLHKAVAGCV